MFGRPLTGEEIQAFQIHSMALGQLINNAVFENEFDKKDFIIDEVVIASETKKRFPNLYNKDNTLNDTALNSFLSQQSLKIDDVVKIIDYEVRSQVFDKLLFKINYPQEVEKILNKHINHTRNIDLIKFNINDFNLPNYNDLDFSITNNQIQDYFAQNTKSYINPEKRDISYLLIDKKDFEDQFFPSNIQIEKYYTNNKALFLEPEKRDFIQFNFKNIEEASQFKTNIASLNYQEIIKFSEENSIKFNEFIEVSNNEVLESLSNVIFSLNIGQVSEIVETPLARHIVIINKIHPENQKTLNQSIDEISNTLKEVETNSFLSDLKNRISQQILEGFSIEEIANDNSLKINNIKRAERQINQIENDIVKSEVIAKGFATNKDFVSDISEIQENVSIIVNVDQIEFEKPFELKEVFEEVSNDWLNSLKIEHLEEEIKEISKNTKSIQDIASYLNIEIENNDLKLDDINYPSILKNNVFANDINEIALSIANEEIYISRLNNITFPEKESNLQSTSLLSELKSNFGSEIIKNKNISTNDNLIQALISQY